MIKNALKENVTQEKTELYFSYLQILNEELIPAMGCTEPISLAYAAAKARCVLGEIPDKIEVVVSGNIIKNVKSTVEKCSVNNKRQLLRELFLEEKIKFLKFWQNFLLNKKLKL